MLTLPRFLLGLALSVGTLIRVTSPVTTDSSGGSYSSVDRSYVSTCTALVVGVGCVSTGDVSSEVVVLGAIVVPLVSGYFLVTGLVVNCLAFNISLFAHIRVEDGPLSFGLVLRCLLPVMLVRFC